MTDVVAILLVAGVAALAAGAALSTLRRLLAPGLVLQAAGLAGVGVAGGLALLGGRSAGSGFSLSLIHI